jgi:antitoxin (DNA-binding transcriptional repressor) of toxin-antitoxin stability system
MEVSTVEFKAQMGRYLNLVREGKTLYITSHRKTVARVEPGESGPRTGIEPPTRPMDALTKVRGVRPASNVDPIRDLLADRRHR